MHGGVRDDHEMEFAEGGIGFVGVHAAEFAMGEGESHFVARIQTGEQGVRAFNHGRTRRRLCPLARTEKLNAEELSLRRDVGDSAVAPR